MRFPKWIISYNMYVIKNVHPSLVYLFGHEPICVANQETKVYMVKTTGGTCVHVPRTYILLLASKGST